MFCFFGVSECAKYVDLCSDEEISETMHSCETVPPAAPPPASGPGLLLQLGRLIIRSRSASPAPRAPPAPRDRLLHAKLIASKPSTSHQVQTQPKPESEEPRSSLEAQLSNHVQALWNDQIPICIEVLLAPNCPECLSSITRPDGEATFDRQHATQRALLLERWTMQALPNKPHEGPAFMTSQWLVNAVRSQLHFSQLAAWLARLKEGNDDNPSERRRKLSRETCNIKKVEANCDAEELAEDKRKLNIVYSIKIPGESYKAAEFPRPPTGHNFPITDIGNNVYLKIVLESLPRIDEIPTVKCTCQKRRASKEIPVNIHEELTGKLNDLTLGVASKYPSDSINSNVGNSARRLYIVTSPGSTEFLFTSDEKKVVDDRLHTPCSENGKHKCNCDDESDTNHKFSTIFQEPKKLDERRLKEIAKYKRRLRKESKLKKLCDSTSSEGDSQQKTATSIPILQAARFDRLRAIGCYRNQTYLTLPASRAESKSPFVDTAVVHPAEFKRTNTVSTQTDDVTCQCGIRLDFDDKCSHRLVRSEANYNLASLDQGTRRKSEDDCKVLKKHKCDIISSKLKCDNIVDNGSASDVIKRPKLHRYFPIVDRLERIVSDRFRKDIEELHLKSDDTVFSIPKETKRQKTFSINDDDYVCLEKCDYGTFDKCDMDSPKEEDLGFRFPDARNGNENRVKRDMVSHKTEECEFKFPDERKETDSGFRFPDAKKGCKVKCDTHSAKEEGFRFPQPRKEFECHDKCDKDTPKEEDGGFRYPDARKGQENQVPSPSEMDKFRWRFDSAASMVFHTKTGLPLTSSPAPLRRGTNCFDFDDSINGISGIKSALFHPISPPSPAPPVSPASPSPSPAPVPAPPASVPAPSPRPRAQEPAPLRGRKEDAPKLRIGPSAGLLGSFEESALKGRLEPVATVHGFTAELGASGAFCPPHRKLPVTVFFYAPGGTNAPYMGHINLGPSGYRVARSGTIQVSLFNPHGTLVKMFVVLYDLTCMPPMARTFLRQRTLYMPAGARPDPPQGHLHKWLRYLIHLRFMTSKSGKLYLHTDIRIIVSRKADLDTATAHSLFRPITAKDPDDKNPGDKNPGDKNPVNKNPGDKNPSDKNPGDKNPVISGRSPNRVFGGSSEFDSELKNEMREFGYDNQNDVSYELRSFTYAPENPKYSPR